MIDTDIDWIRELAAIEHAETELAAAVHDLEATGGVFIRADGRVPQQVEGIIDGHYFYLHCRDGAWDLTVYPGIAVLHDHTTPDGILIGFGDYPDIWGEDPETMSPAVALRFAAARVHEWLASC